MTEETRAKAKKASQLASELYHLLEELGRELTKREDFAGYLHLQEVNDHVFGRGRNVDVLGKLNAVATMGEPYSPANEPPPVGGIADAKKTRRK